MAEQLALFFTQPPRESPAAPEPHSKRGPTDTDLVSESPVATGPDIQSLAIPPAASSDGPVVVHAAPGVSLEIQRSAEELTGTLAALFGESVRLTITDNRRTMVSGGRKRGRLDLRLHRMFLNAPEAVVHALHAYLAHRDRRAGKIIDAFIDARRGTIRHRQRRIALRVKGRHHDLATIFAGLEAQYFAGELEGVRITWGRRSTRRRQRSIRLGTYALAEQLIRVHPVLDNEWVPAFYVEAVVHHEMLHHVLPPERGATRTNFHTPEFRRRERLFPAYAASEKWEEANLSRLLASASR